MTTPISYASGPNAPSGMEVKWGGKRGWRAYFWGRLAVVFWNEPEWKVLLAHGVIRRVEA